MRVVGLPEQGFSIVGDVLNPQEVASLIDAMASVEHCESVRTRGGIYAIRNLLQLVPEISALAASLRIRSLVSDALGKQAFPVRGIFFDKTPDANWLVPWHQDLSISVKRRFEIDGYGPWSIKAGVHHVQPPQGILEAMLSVRLHLDDCGENNGPLRVLPGTHRNGRLAAREIVRSIAQIAPVTCTVGAGGVVLMRPLLVHSSVAAEQAGHRRVIHIDFASCRLASGLSWLD